MWLYNKNFWLKLFLSVLMISTTKGLIYSQNLIFRNITVEDGLSNNYVSAIFRDYRGFMWFGTLDGLDRFDGVEIRHYSQKIADSPIKVNSITNNANTGLWIGTDKGLFCLDFKTDSLIKISIENNSPMINTLTPFSEDSMLFVGTSNGPAVLNCRTLEYNKIKIDGRDNINVTDAVLDNNKIWITTSSFLLRFSIDDYNLKYFINPGNSNAFNNFSSVAVIDNRVVVGSQSKGLFQFNPEQEIFEPYIDVENPMILSLKYRSDGKLFIGTDGGGLVVLNTKNSEVHTYKKESSYLNSINSDAVYSLYLDKIGRCWVGTYNGGAAFTTTREGGFEVIIEENNLSFAQKSIRSLHIDDAGNKYIGTRTGLNILLKDGESYFFDKENSLLSSNVITTLNMHNEDLIIGTFRGGAYKFQNSTGKLKSSNFSIINSAETIYGFEHDSKENLYIATMYGLYCKEAESDKIEYYTKENSALTDNRLISILIDSSERLWLGTIANGIILFKTEGGKLTLIEPQIDLSQYKTVSFFEDSNNNIWIASEKRGLIKVSEQLDSKIEYTTNNGLSNNSVSAITEAPDGKLWITTLKGLCSLDLSTEIFTNYTTSDGLPGLVFNRNAIVNTFNKDQHILLGSESGLIRFNPTLIDKSTLETDVTVTDIFVNGERTDINEKTVKNGKDQLIKELQLKEDQNNIEFRFIALNYRNPSDNTYVFKLKGADEKWQTTTGNFALYSNLKPGRYTFQTALQNNINDPSKYSEIYINITYKWYQHYIFRLSVILIIAFLLYYIIKRFKKLQKKIFEIQAVKTDIQKDGKKYESSSLTKERRDEIETLLLKIVAEERLFLNSELKLNDLADSVNCSPHDVSQVINQNLNRSFYDFINEYRVDEIKKRMVDPNFKRYTLYAIAQESGFRSKTSFHRAFKKITGFTPSEYKNSLDQKAFENS